MARITGSNTKLVVQNALIATAHGTSLAAGAGDLVPFNSFTWNENAGELTNSPNGLGKSMLTDAIRGAVEPSFTLEKVMGFQDGTDRLFAQFFGTSAAPTEVTVGQSDYKHTMTLNQTANNIHTAIAYQSSDSTTVELPSSSVETITVTAENPPSYAKLTVSGKSNKVELSSAVNTYAVVAAATVVDDEECVADELDTFRINLRSGGALAGGDAVNITRYVLTLNRPQSFVHEFRGSAGNTATLASDLINGTLSVTLRGLADHTYLTAAQAGTEYKCSFQFDGSQIGSGTNKTFKFWIPKMKLITNPDAPISSSGENPVTLNFKILAATTAPTGMTSVYPYLELTNGFASAYVA